MRACVRVCACACLCVDAAINSTHGYVQIRGLTCSPTAPAGTHLETCAQALSSLHGWPPKHVFTQSWLIYVALYLAWPPSLWRARSRSPTATPQHSRRLAGDLGWGGCRSFPSRETHLKQGEVDLCCPPTLLSSIGVPSWPPLSKLRLSGASIQGLGSLKVWTVERGPWLFFCSANRSQVPPWFQALGRLRGPQDILSTWHRRLTEGLWVNL